MVTVVAQAVARFYVAYPQRAELPVFFVVSGIVAVPVIAVIQLAAAFRVGAVTQVVALVLEAQVRREWRGWGWGRGALRWCSRPGGP
jgi:hypothetical protein